MQSTAQCEHAGVERWCNSHMHCSLRKNPLCSFLNLFISALSKYNVPALTFHLYIFCFLSFCSRQQPPHLPFPSVPLQHHSPMSSQASSISSSLHSTSLPLFPMGMTSHPTPSPCPSPIQPLPPEAFTIVERAHQMVEILTKENGTLRQQLEICYEKADKLQKVRNLHNLFTVSCISGK